LKDLKFCEIPCRESRILLKVYIEFAGFSTFLCNSVSTYPQILITDVRFKKTGTEQAPFYLGGEENK
jgi:hypothetical protein